MKPKAPLVAYIRNGNTKPKVNSASEKGKHFRAVIAG